MSPNNRQKDIAGLLAEWREATDGVSHDMATEFDTDGDFNITLYADPDDETSEQAVANLNFLRLAPVAIPSLLTAVENVLKLHQPRVVQCIYGDCAAEMCDHEDIEDCPTKDFQQCVECDRLADEVSTYYSETQAYLTEWPCVTVTAIRDALGGAA